MSKKCLVRGAKYWFYTKKLKKREIFISNFSWPDAARHFIEQTYFLNFETEYKR